MRGDRRPSLPTARGPLSERVLDTLRRPPGTAVDLPAVEDEPLTGDDLHLALYACYELHYRGFAGVDDGWEWDLGLLDARRHLEDPFEAALVDESGPTGTPGRDGATVPHPAETAAELRTLIAEAEGPSLSSFALERATLTQVREFAVHRSAYQLKEADPHTWAIPRLEGRAKAAMVEIQADEYGGGHEPAMHATLFGDTMRGLGLDATYGAYLDALPGTTLATVNLISLLGLKRRWRGALVGHLATFEMTSVQPMGRYAAVLRRLGCDAGTTRFYDVHVEADAHHEVVAANDLVGGLVADEPALAGDVLFGARALMAVEGRFAGRLLDAWATGRSSLLVPLDLALAG